MYLHGFLMASFSCHGFAFLLWHVHTFLILSRNTFFFRDLFAILFVFGLTNGLLVLPITFLLRNLNENFPTIPGFANLANVFTIRPRNRFRNSTTSFLAFWLTNFVVCLKKELGKWIILLIFVHKYISKPYQRTSLHLSIYLFQHRSTGFLTHCFTSRHFSCGIFSQVFSYFVRHFCRIMQSCKKRQSSLFTSFLFGHVTVGLRADWRNWLTENNLIGCWNAGLTL